MGKIKLAFHKFKKLVDRYNYIIVSAYYVDDECRFIECKTPHQLKTFMVYISSKYSLVIDDSVKKIDIAESPSGMSSRQMEYMTSARGPLLDCDIVALSASSICLYRKNEKMECYYINTGESKTLNDDDSDDEEEEDVDEITTLENQADSLIQQLTPGTKLKTGSTLVVVAEDDDEDEATPVETKVEPEKEITIEVKSDMKSVDVEEPSDDESEVELVFKDSEDGDVIDKGGPVVKMMNPGEDDEDEDGDDEDGDDDDGDISSDNSVPGGIEESDVNLGIIYVSIELNSFFRDIATHENAIIQCYIQLSENEADLRTERLSKIKAMTSMFLERADLRMEELKSDEARLILQLSRLSSILVQIERVRNKIQDKKDPSLSDADTLYHKTRKTIHDLNIELHRLKDLSDEILTNYKSSLEDMIGL